MAPLLPHVSRPYCTRQQHGAAAHQHRPPKLVRPSKNDRGDVREEFETVLEGSFDEGERTAVRILDLLCTREMAASATLSRDTMDDLDTVTTYLLDDDLRAKINAP